MDYASFNARLEALYERGALTSSELSTERSRLFSYFSDAETPSRFEQAGSKRWLFGLITVGLVGYVAYMTFPQSPLGQTDLSSESAETSVATAGPQSTTPGSIAPDEAVDSALAAAEAAVADAAEADDLEAQADALRAEDDMLSASETEATNLRESSPEMVPTGPRRAKGNVSGLFSTDDYPTAALKLGAEGTTTIRLQVGANGHATGCSVVASSGFEELDSATCAILLRRARFQPAIDENGLPTTDSFVSRIRWQLPE